MKLWLWTVLVALDQMANVVFGRLLNWVLDPLHLFGEIDETLSSVFGKNVQAGTCRACHAVCKILHLLDPGHCEKSIEADEGRMREPREPYNPLPQDKRYDSN